jgi:hypothetical protein
VTKVIIKTAKANDPIYKEGITISSSLGAAMMRARKNYLKRIRTSQENPELKYRQELVLEAKK